eukprot:CAMPEP_0181203040 /NCGR_PEP_ID=MMETSP1096-20121128/19169_1 /TAXON_ID=156174 ORGANISM="Chrysochromulina ericina, Strain CCMP281" /NCGR_SAMPLE_ID=MMETSP1096 /ASSEMBLY_ACC=CAM_ASM_000453 /LENGTH=183 /DNA_ID=CAMNT_0023293605 /DNA_START=198 /DNA_END=749 /DNA_ORIENTATION=-
MIPNSLGICLCNVIGRQLGAGDIKAAKQTAVIMVSTGTVLAIAYSTAVFIFGRRIGMFFTNAEDVLEQRESIWPWVSLFLVVDALFGMLAGLNRSLGIQARSAVCVWVCLWLIGTPLIFMFASDLDLTWRIVPGIYSFFVLALLSCSLFANWHHLAASAKSNSDKQKLWDGSHSTLDDALLAS